MAFDELPKIHDRYYIVRSAASDLAMAMGDIIKKYGLTHSEVTNVLAEEILLWNKYAIRAERHPNDPNARGDEAPSV